MKEINNVTIIGRLTKDPDMKYATNQTAVLKFSIANNSKEHTNFFNCVMFGKYAESMQQYLRKGTKIGIQGNIKQDSWKDNEGRMRTNVSIICDNINLLDGKKSNQNNQQSQQQQQEDDFPEFNENDTNDVPF